MTASTPVPACHACQSPATQQWARAATDDEATQYHASMDVWRTSQGLPPMPETAAIRQAPVLMAVYGCDDHGQEVADGEGAVSGQGPDAGPPV